MKEPEIRRSWERIEAWTKIHFPHALDHLNPGATDAQIAEAEKTIGIAFPEEARISFRIHDGCGTYENMYGVLSQRSLYSVLETAQSWLVWKNVTADSLFSRIKGEPEGPIRDDWWNPCWLPISDDASVNEYCLDMDPAPGGFVGQIISIRHHEPDRRIIAYSYGEWLKEYANDLDAGKYVVDRDEYGIVPRDFTY